jgi:hypothetical protein
VDVALLAPALEPRGASGLLTRRHTSLRYYQHAHDACAEISHFFFFFFFAVSCVGTARVLHLRLNFL